MRKLTERDIQGIIGSTIEGFRVETARIKNGPFIDSDHYGFILARNAHGCYVTWRFHLLEDESVSAYWGHYFQEDRDAAVRDFDIIKPDGKYTDRTCRYISETHMTCGWDDRLYHVHDFAELMENAGNTVIPLRSSLPEKSFAVLETTSEVIIIHRGAKGYTPTGQRPEGAGDQDGADKLNETIGVTRAQAAAMLAGSMFGWACPGADPVNYDVQDRPVKNRS